LNSAAEASGTGKFMTKLFRTPVGNAIPETPAGNRPRLAIVSTFDDLCGIAGYTRFLVKQIERDFEVEVFDLDQFFMRSTNRRVRKIADQMIREFCVRAKSFDFVNIQLEHGTLGRNARDIMRRFRWIAEAAPALSVTFHTILPHESLIGRRSCWSLLGFACPKWSTSLPANALRPG
jgi:hypothetical protein